MSKFLSSAENYSEINVFKIKKLKPLLELYNKYIMTSTSSYNFELLEKKSYIIPNNNNKYYCLITNKGNYKNMYFFPDTNSISTLSDFYVEIDSNKIPEIKSKEILFEGYLYKDSIKNLNEFLISDLLIIDGKVISCEYSLRFSLINEIIKSSILLNGHLILGIHPNFENKSIYDIFKCNFKYGKNINSIEYIPEFKSLKKNIFIKCKFSDKIINKRIYKSKYFDVYNVHNIDTNNFESLLYIKTISESRSLLKLFEENEFVEIPCKFNEKFLKWSAFY
jgi:hypothetical protein